MKNLTKKSNLGWVLLLVEVLLTIIYSQLYILYLDHSYGPSLGRHIAGFFGLFVPVGPLSLVTALLLPSYLVAVSVSSLLIYFAIFIGNRLPITGKIGKILFILVTLFLITMISDLVRQTGLLSWYIFIHGSLPPLS